MHKVHRYHDFCAGHRVVGHENKCRHLHGHNYRVHFTCVPEDSLDELGRVIDFSVMKSLLCEWLEENWDHKMILWEHDPILAGIIGAQDLDVWDDSIVDVPFNPTAENMAQYLVEVIGPRQLLGTNVKLVSVTIEETRKCSATYTLRGYGV